MKRLALICGLAAGIAGTSALRAQLVPWIEPPSMLEPEAAPRWVPVRRARIASPPLLSAVALQDKVAVAEEVLEKSTASLSSPSDTILLSSFSAASGGGSVRAGTSWVGQVTQNANTITVGGTAGDDNGWGVTGLALNATGMNYLTITAQRDAGNLAPTLFIQLEDSLLRTKVYSISTSSFAVGVPTTVSIPLANWTIDFGPSAISGWSIGGGSVGTVPFRLTLDDLAFTTVSAVPEPGTVALLAGLSALGFAAYRRRRCRRS